MKIKILLYLSILVLTAGNVFAQEKQIKKANKKFNDLSYIDAISIYERVANKGYKSAELFQKLGDSYYFNSQFEKASKWYGELFFLDNSDISAEYFYRYAQTLKSVGEYEKANEMLEKFTALSGNDIRGDLFSKKKNYLEIIKSNSGRYIIKEAGINSEYSDFGTAFYGDNIVFASSRDTSGLFKREHTWTNQAFLDLYVSEIKSDTIMSKPEKFSKKINSKFNESTPVFTKDGKTVYFTRNNFKDGKKGKDAQKTTLLKLYSATLKENSWEDVTELPFNSDNYNNAHPALSVDEKTLYFASDMPGTLGQSDIFKVTINDDGSFGTPENLGPQINTEGKETFPFVSAENELYFASDGHPGLGGLDVFVSKINGDNAFREPINIGTPINSPTDDFAFIINVERKGFFSSNRAEGKGFDDIYTFIETKKPTCQQILSGTITDDETGEPLSNVEVMLLDKKFEVVGKQNTDARGFYSFETACGKIYYLRTSKEDFETIENKIIVPNESGKTTLPITQKKNVKVISLKDDIAKMLNIKMIYFDLDKSFIREDAKVELAKVLEVMLQYPTLKIDVRSHTDSRQTHQYNQKLSDRRVKATIAWLVQQGISPERLTGKGYGETQLINECKDGVECTEEQHQINRRSEFIVEAL
ncbi:outer membrane protein OmpA-like peptidoglycan-associated protein/tetratricopeptide (TPR) repeat protein [Flavobacterium arsenatis]|uniref:Outer membrane protein OmpA-like peptidoglycan-associated protein/tetratricopeptide (TPR) repeat protein n=1 Tax=Flavobacterium arsenatis TaxID=1484332 RepID=A0ABU1TJS7_9FLAO|nr:OmpA family protein [Flavobacterium arsenatis]MDR6966185.1 outer membrane protein OmpA-like peptidoglycan-associated protein/tetratricopeptide (TPR) repeat protein [Flavobacterium arsenatis]